MNKNNNFIYHFAIFLFSSIGVFLTYRMHILHANNQNCGEDGSCLQAFNSFSIFGFSNIELGMFYYSTLTILGLGALFLNKTINKKISLLKNSMIVFGFIYSLYLVSYLFFSDLGFCELCLYSACICTILFILVIKSGFRRTIEVKGKTKYLYLASISIIIFLIIFNNSKELELESDKNFVDLPVYNIPIAGSVVLGNPNAMITITEFTDFQ